jgi:hypothetical protein
MNRTDLRPRIQEQRVMDAWDPVVGNAIAEVTQPMRVRNRVLQVRVIHPVWMQELQFHKKLILQKMNDFLGASLVEDLRWVLGEREKKEAGKKREKAGKFQRELKPEEKERIEKEVSRLRDGEMREALSRLFSKQLMRERGKAQK